MKTAINHDERYGCQAVIFVATFLTLCANAGALFAQQVETTGIYSEAPIVFEDGVKKSQYVNVKFKQNVLWLPAGVATASTADLASSFSNIVSHFSKLEQRYGKMVFFKKIPTVAWGDVWSTNKRTGKLVRVPDMSQLFIMQFPQLVPVDSTVAELEKLEEVEYAYQPIQAMSLAEPNDPCYNNISSCYHLQLQVTSGI